MSSIAKLISVISFCALVAACQPGEAIISKDLELQALGCKIHIPDGYRMRNNDGFIHGSFSRHDPSLPNIFQYNPNHSMKDHASKNNIYYEILSEEQLGSWSLLRVTLEPEIDARSKFNVITSDSAFFVTPEETGAIFLDQFGECAGTLANKALKTDASDAGAG